MSEAGTGGESATGPVSPAEGEASAPLAEPAAASVVGLQLTGLGLFLFIPLVLYLLVVHPRPIAASLPAALLLIVGHRLLARPYMRRARLRKCLWCNRGLGTVTATLPVPAGRETLEAAVCPHHRAPAARFFALLARLALPLRLGIFAPLLLLVVALAVAATGSAGPPALDGSVALFQLVVGLTVNVAAFGYALAPAEAPARLPFPAHNFFLLGIRNLLWVFRLVGLWWIVRGGWALLGGAVASGPG